MVFGQRWVMFKLRFMAWDKKAFLSLEIINLLEKILRKAGLLKNGNSRFPYFIYSNYKINTIQNIMLIYSLKFIYRCKFDEIRPNLLFYKTGLVGLSSVCSAMKDKKPYLAGIEAFRVCLVMSDSRMIWYYLVTIENLLDNSWKTLANQPTW